MPTMISCRGRVASFAQQKARKLAKSVARFHLAPLPNPVDATRRIRMPRQVSRF